MIDYSSLSLVADNYFIVDGGYCQNCGDDGCDHCGWTGHIDPHDADLSNLLHNLAVAGAMTAVGRTGYSFGFTDGARALAKAEHDLRNAAQRCIALEHAAEVLAAENAEAKADVLRQAARIAALESELTTLQASVVAALSSAGPEVGEDERTA